MNQTTQPLDEAYEARLMIFHKRLLESLIRREAVEAKVSDALELAQDERLPRQTIELGMNCYGLPS
jgi:hypothetical protein